jgi:hypothetical protein
VQESLPGQPSPQQQQQEEEVHGTVPCWQHAQLSFISLLTQLTQLTRLQMDIQSTPLLEGSSGVFSGLLQLEELSLNLRDSFQISGGTGRSLPYSQALQGLPRSITKLDLVLSLYYHSEDFGITIVPALEHLSALRHLRVYVNNEGGRIDCRFLASMPYAANLRVLVPEGWLRPGAMAVLLDVMPQMTSLVQRL